MKRLFPIMNRYFSTLTQVKTKLQNIRKETFECWISHPAKLPARPIEGIDPGKNPAVFLLGWAGCRQRDLAKYNSIYEDMGCPTVQSIATMKTLFSSKSGTFIVEHAKELIELGKNNNLLEKPIIFHMFSNGGSAVYHYVSTFLRENHKDVRIVGCIYDSAPAVVTFKSTLQLLMRMTEGSTVWRYIVALPAVIWFRFRFHSERAYSYVSGKPYVERRVWDQLVVEPNVCPQLFLYSKIDQMTDYKGVDAFIKARQKLGVKTVQMRWDDTDHVAHLRKHADDYVSRVRDFVKMCLLDSRQK